MPTERLAALPDGVSFADPRRCRSPASRRCARCGRAACARPPRARDRRSGRRRPLRDPARGPCGRERDSDRRTAGACGGSGGTRRRRDPALDRRRARAVRPDPRVSGRRLARPRVDARRTTRHGRDVRNSSGEPATFDPAPFYRTWWAIASRLHPLRAGAGALRGRPRALADLVAAASCTRRSAARRAGEAAETVRALLDRQVAGKAVLRVRA